MEKCDCCGNRLFRCPCGELVCPISAHRCPQSIEVNTVIEFQSDWRKFHTKWNDKLPAGHFKLHFTLIDGMIESLTEKEGEDYDPERTCPVCDHIFIADKDDPAINCEGCRTPDDYPFIKQQNENMKRKAEAAAKKVMKLFEDQPPK